MMVRRILVTGANKGIGLAIVIRCLTDHADTHMIMACRNLDRGETAANEITKDHPEWKERLTVIEMDTSLDDSVKTASEQLKKEFSEKDTPSDEDKLLYGIVNNAGIAFGSIKEVLNVNTYGPKRVNDNFLPFLDPKVGRIVQMSSAAGPIFVKETSPTRQEFFTNPNVTWEQIETLMQDIQKDDSEEGFKNKGLGDGGANAGYGLSKALLNCYTAALAKEHPHLKINACTPGMIATDIIGSFLPWWVPIPNAFIKFLATKLINAKTPDEGTVSTMHLLFLDDIQGNGYYYGSDAKRSPLDKYRAPGSPPYEGP